MESCGSDCLFSLISSCHASKAFSTWKSPKRFSEKYLLAFKKRLKILWLSRGCTLPTSNSSAASVCVCQLTNWGFPLSRKRSERELYSSRKRSINRQREKERESRHLIHRPFISMEEQISRVTRPSFSSKVLTKERCVKYLWAAFPANTCNTCYKCTH